jgi:hypothetical protein
MAKLTDTKGGEGTLPPSHHPQVVTLDAIIQALYESVSFLPGRQPDYQRLRALFHPDARILPPRAERAAALELLDIDTFIMRSREVVVTTGLERLGFHEKEVARRTGTFGAMTHVFSTYESRHTMQDTVPLQRGINSIQLVRGSNRFWVVSMLWEAESPGHPIPRTFLV